MKQEFTKLEDGKVRWEYIHEEKEFTDKEFGSVGVTSKQGYIIFDSKEKALAVLDRDYSEIEQRANKYLEDMQKNEHDLDNFPLIKDLVESIGKLHNDFKEVTGDKIYSLYNNEPKKYQKLLAEFNKSKDYIKEEISSFNSQYQKYLNYKPAKQAYEFESEQLAKVQEERNKLLEL